MRIGQVILGAGATQLVTGKNTYASFISIQNNAAAVVRIGDNTVSASRGIALASGTPGGSATFFLNIPQGTLLNSYYLFGTAAQVIDFLYESSE